MRVFVTGASGFIGSAVVGELLAAGHGVLGLTRSDEGASALAAAGAEALRATLEDLETLRAAAARSDAVIHLAFNHDFSRYLANCEEDRRVVETLGAALAGSGRPLIVTSGTGMSRTAPGKVASEEDAAAPSSLAPRAASEEAALAAASSGAAVSVVRLPQVHDTRRQGLISYAIAIARAKGVSAYIGDGGNRWPAAHRLDTARLYRLALEKAEPGAIYHAVAEEGVSLRAIAETIGQRLALPVASLAPDEAEAHFGWLAAFAERDLPASSALTQQRLDWQPTGPGLIADLERLEEDQG
ncbi:SDR family oxidoreductase [Flavisphingomonas formosensis]|uniref:SDR family oxidoreductase n=1 Tax=Flavisphingomonas formosensis TaxID=861534 RepID=UPI0012F8181B|nr:SDR family oxidoreductase [Sphingomonas formosensis]